MSNASNMLTKVQALLTKAERGATPEEAKLLVAKAQELMVKYAISEAMLAQAKPGEEREPIETLNLWIEFSPYQTPKVYLLNVVARANDCRIVLTQAYKRDDQGQYVYDAKGRLVKGQRATVVGFATSLKFVEQLYTSLLVQAEVEFRTPAVQDLMFAQTSHPGHRIKWRNDFMLGFNSGVGRKLHEARKTVVDQAGTGSELALLDRNQLVQAEYERLFPKLKTMKASAGGGSAAAWHSGRAAGQRADVGQTKVGGNRTALGGAK
jgi:hypothetical protein